MANKKENKKNTNYSNTTNNNKKKSSGNSKKIVYNNIIMKLLVFFGVIILTTTIVYLMKYFFVDKNNLQINMSTDKKLEYIIINNQEEVLTTQKYVSDLKYSMRYDVDNFKVFKYKGQDIYRFNTAERVMLAIEVSELPTNCTTTATQGDYNKCTIDVDEDTKEYYFSDNNTTYKMILKTPNDASKDENIMKRINYMINSFEIN